MSTLTTSPTVSFLSKYVRWDFIVMLVLFAVIFGFEMVGVFRERYITITEIICRYVPTWARAMVWGWLGYHFLIQNK